MRYYFIDYMSTSAIYTYNKQLAEEILNSSLYKEKCIHVLTYLEDENELNFWLTSVTNFEEFEKSYKFRVYEEIERTLRQYIIAKDEIEQLKKNLKLYRKGNIYGVQ